MSQLFPILFSIKKKFCKENFILNYIKTCILFNYKRNLFWLLIHFYNYCNICSFEFFPFVLQMIATIYTLSLHYASAIAMNNMQQFLFSFWFQFLFYFPHFLCFIISARELFKMDCHVVCAEKRNLFAWQFPNWSDKQASAAVSVSLISPAAVTGH